MNFSISFPLYLLAFISILITFQITATEVTSNSITVSVTASGGDGSIVSYHYSIDDGEYISSNSNSYTFENLNAETSYDISVYVSDSNERDSNVYNVDVTTESDLISFTITDIYTSTTTMYRADEGMVFKEWLNSDYNTSDCWEHCPDSFEDDRVYCGSFKILSIGRDEIITNGASYSYDSSESIPLIPYR